MAHVKAKRPFEAYKYQRAQGNITSTIISTTSYHNDRHRLALPPANPAYQELAGESACPWCCVFNGR